MRRTPTAPIAIPALAPVERPCLKVEGPGTTGDEVGEFVELLTVVGLDSPEEVDVPVEDAPVADEDLWTPDVKSIALTVLLVLVTLALLALEKLDKQLTTLGKFVTPSVAHICRT